MEKARPNDSLKTLKLKAALKIIDCQEEPLAIGSCFRRKAATMGRFSRSRRAENGQKRTVLIGLEELH